MCQIYSISAQPVVMFIILPMKFLVQLPMVLALF